MILIKLIYQIGKKYLPIMKKREPQSLQNCLTNLRKSWEELDKLSIINENWNRLVGSELFKECKPLKIERKVLTVAVNNLQWRQALIYNRHRLKERIEKIGINLEEIKIIQNYEINKLNKNILNSNEVWDQHPSRVNKKNISICKFCGCPTPMGELSRWGKCTFCWRNNL